jgi:hypothetical protein
MDADAVISQLYRLDTSGVWMQMQMRLHCCPDIASFNINYLRDKSVRTAQDRELLEGVLLMLATGEISMEH